MDAEFQQQLLSKLRDEITRDGLQIRLLMGCKRVRRVVAQLWLNTDEFKIMKRSWRVKNVVQG